MELLIKNKLGEESVLLIPVLKNGLDHDRLKKYGDFSSLTFEGNFKEIENLYLSGGNRIFLLGLGDDQNKNERCEAFRSFLHHNYHKLSKLTVDATDLESDIINDMVLGFKMAQYDPGLLKTEQKTVTLTTIEIVSDIAPDSIEEAEQTGETINRIKAIVDLPAEKKTPAYLAQWAVDSAKEYGYVTEIYDEKRLKDEGFGSILAVGKGSIHPPRMIILKWNPTGSNSPDVVLIGKGITFDTGGLSIKPSQNLHYMKSDMGGAAAVLGTLELAARLGIQKHIVGIVASAENAVDANSYRPGDVIESYSGKTIEVIDTDAEGRLALADAISFAIKNLEPTTLIDLATLTGSVVRTLGYSSAGLFTNSDQLANDLSSVGERVKERVWRLPLYQEFEDELYSDIADLKNLTMKPVAGAINAAKFLEVFTEGHESWAHLDIAGVAFRDSEYAKMKTSTGFGVRLLIEYLRS